MSIIKRIILLSIISANLANAAGVTNNFERKIITLSGSEQVKSTVQLSPNTKKTYKKELFLKTDDNFITCSMTYDLPSELEVIGGFSHKETDLIRGTLTTLLEDKHTLGGILHSNAISYNGVTENGKREANTIICYGATEDGKRIASKSFIVIFKGSGDGFDNLIINYKQINPDESLFNKMLATLAESFSLEEKLPHQGSKLITSIIVDGGSANQKFNNPFLSYFHNKKLQNYHGFDFSKDKHKAFTATSIGDGLYKLDNFASSDKIIIVKKSSGFTGNEFFHKMYNAKLQYRELGSCISSIFTSPIEGGVITTDCVNSDYKYFADCSVVNLIYNDTMITLYRMTSSKENFNKIINLVSNGSIKGDDKKLPAFNLGDKMIVFMKNSLGLSNKCLLNKNSFKLKTKNFKLKIINNKKINAAIINSGYVSKNLAKGLFSCAKDVVSYNIIYQKESIGELSLIRNGTEKSLDYLLLYNCIQNYMWYGYSGICFDNYEPIVVDHNICGRILNIRDRMIAIGVVNGATFYIEINESKNKDLVIQALKELNQK